MDGNKPILLLEDDEVDAMNVRRAFRDINIRNKLIACTNGEEGLSYLNDESKENPCVILLDLNMPRMNGIEFLQEVKRTPLLKRTPVVILTTSKEDNDRFESFDLGIAGYIIKPVDYAQFVEAMRAVNLYWTLSEFP